MNETIAAWADGMKSVARVMDLLDYFGRLQRNIGQNERQEEKQFAFARESDAAMVRNEAQSELVQALTQCRLNYMTKTHELDEQRAAKDLINATLAGTVMERDTFKQALKNSVVVISEPFGERTVWCVQCQRRIPYNPDRQIPLMHADDCVMHKVEVA